MPQPPSGTIEDILGDVLGHSHIAPKAPPKTKQVQPKFQPIGTGFESGHIVSPVMPPEGLGHYSIPVTPAVDEPPTASKQIRSGPTMLDCGHSDWYGDTANEASRGKGFCCQGGEQKIIPSPIDRKGIYAKPLPANIRRTREKTLGFQGYCVDDKGFYIGGMTNDCRKHRPEGTLPCKAHRPIEAEVEPEPDPPEEGVEDVLSSLSDLTPPPKMSFKQRQLEIRKQRKGK